MDTLLNVTLGFESRLVYFSARDLLVLGRLSRKVRERELAIFDGSLRERELAIFDWN